MAAKTWYLQSGFAGCSESGPGAEAYASPTLGWIVSTGAGVDYSSLAEGTEQAASTFGATVQPDGSLVAAPADYFLLTNDGALTGTFDAGTWNFHLAVRAQTAGGAQDGAATYRLFKGTSVGAAVEITSGVVTGSTVTDLATSATQTSTGSVALGAITCTNEHLYLQTGWKRTGAGGMTSSDVNVRTGTTTGTRFISPNFTAGGASAIAAAEGMVFGQAAALTGTGALAGVAPEVFGQTAVIRADGALAGVAAEVFGQNAVLSTLPTPIAGVAAEVFGQAAALTGTGALAGVAPEVFGQNAVIRADGALAGVAAEVFGQAAALKGTGALAGVAAEVFGDNAALGSAGSGAIAAVGTITFTQAAALTGSGALAGIAAEVFGDSATVVQPAAPAAATPTVTPAGRSTPGRKRRWLIGNRVFYGTADEAAALAEEEDLPEPQPAPKAKIAKPKAKPAVVDEIRSFELPPIPAFQGLDFGLLEDQASMQRLAQSMNEQVQWLQNKIAEEDDEDVLLLLWH